MKVYELEEEIYIICGHGEDSATLQPILEFLKTLGNVTFRPDCKGNVSINLRGYIPKVSALDNSFSDKLDKASVNVLDC